MFKGFTIGVGVGYVLGARAGQKRYEQITDLAQRALELPIMQRLAENGRTIAEEQGRRLMSELRDRARWNDDGGSDEADEGAYDDEDAYDQDDEAEGDYDDEDEGAYDQDDEAADTYDDEDDAAEDEGADEQEEQGAYDQDDEDAYDDEDDDDQDDDAEDAAEGEDEDKGGRRAGRGRRGVGSVVSAARERGRVA